MIGKDLVQVVLIGGYSVGFRGWCREGDLPERQPQNPSVMGKTTVDQSLSY